MLQFAHHFCAFCPMGVSTQSSALTRRHYRASQPKESRIFSQLGCPYLIIRYYPFHLLQRPRIAPFSILIIVQLRELVRFITYAANCKAIWKFTSTVQPYYLLYADSFSLKQCQINYKMAQMSHTSCNLRLNIFENSPFLKKFSNNFFLFWY